MSVLLPGMWRHPVEFLQHSVRSHSGAHPVSCLKDTGRLFPGVELAGYWNRSFAQRHVELASTDPMQLETTEQSSWGSQTEHEIHVVYLCGVTSSK